MITDIIRNKLAEHADVILFAYLFGSHAEGPVTPESDVDIAVFLNNSLDGSVFDIKTRLYLELSRALKRNDIDLVILNNCRNLILLDRIIHHGTLIFCRNESRRLDYEQQILHRVIDFRQQRQRIMGV